MSEEPDTNRGEERNDTRTEYVVVSVTQAWHFAAERFLRRFGHPDSDAAKRFLIAAHVIDDTDPKGLWLKYQENNETPEYSLFIPWLHVLTIAQAEEFSPEVKEETRKVGFPLS